MLSKKFFTLFSFNENAAEAIFKAEMELGQIERTNKLNLARMLSLVMLLLSSSGLISFLGLAILSGELIWLGGEIAELTSIGCLFAGLSLIKRKLYRPASWFIVISLLLPILFSWWMLGTDVAMGLTLFMPLILAVHLLEGLEILAFSLLIIIIQVGWYVGQHLLKLFKPVVELNEQNLAWINLLLIVVAIPGLVILMRVPARLQLTSMQSQNKRLQKTLQQLEARYHTGQQVSQSVQSMAIQLIGTASQQASGSQEQVSIVNEVYSSVIELSEAANNIERLASNVDASVNRVATQSRQIEETASEAANRSQKGLEAIAKAVQAINQTTQLYQNLLSEMNDLRKKSSNMRMILDLLKSIASQTHLLSLNAAIEAAGAGERGERFGVVAQEVKNLAERSAQANQEVVAIIQQIEESARTAVTSTEGAYLQAQTIQEAVNYTGTIIQEISQVVLQSREQAITISRASYSVKELTEVIQSATTQQRGASEQVLQALKGLSIVAEQSAEGSHMIATTADGLEELSQHLKTALAA